MTTSTYNIKGQLFSFVSGINASGNISSSMGNYTTAFQEGMAEDRQREVRNAILDENSIASKIINNPKTNRYSEKQMWVIVFELLKNEEFVKSFTNKLNGVEEEVIEEQEVDMAGYIPHGESDKVDASTLEVGAEIYHERFEDGIVLSNDGTNIEIDFDGEIKKFICKYVSLELN